MLVTHSLSFLKKVTSKSHEGDERTFVVIFTNERSAKRSS
jgi:hypothetical protein